MTVRGRWLSVSTALFISACVGVAVPSGFEVAVSNETSGGYVVGVDVQVGTELEPRFYASPPASTVVVDTVGEANFATPRVLIFNALCEQLEVVTANFESGGLVALRMGAQATVELGREITGQRANPDALMGDTDCAAAAARL